MTEGKRASRARKSRHPPPPWIRPPGLDPPLNSNPWLHDGTWKKVKERRQLKLKLESTRSERVKKRIKEQYKGKDQEVKQSAREDKRHWMNEMTDTVERAAENGRAGELHRIVKTLTGEKKRTSTVISVVNDKNGKPTNERSERLKIWKEHFDTTKQRITCQAYTAT